MSYVKIKKEAYDLLYYECFKTLSKDTKSAVVRAYRDLCRTLSGFAKNENKDEIKKEAVKTLIEETDEILKIKEITKDEFDMWHMQCCNNLKSVFDRYNFPFYIGHAQKWINMTLKYIYIITPPKVEHLLNFLHIPVDQYIISGLKEKDGFVPFNCSWSRLNDYDIYMKFQSWFASLSDEPPLLMEFALWIEEAENREDS